ncbi:beta-ketoacyl synthase chain length factor [Chitinophaga alhagiae]|nr:beta-ketoacyl synthase chain length factor [Chitinophaga alhagiae]
MKGKVYIRGCAAISPQESFSGSFVPQPPTLADDNILRAKEPDYKAFIAPNNLRRMSRMLKMGLTAALQCLQNAGITVPDAIITGTGKGSLQDTERFLHDIRQYAEAALNPTPFIQSTYNSVNGLIALQQQCTRYNNTFVHRGFSFEHAVLDGLMLLREGNAANVLAGGFDEITKEHFYIKSRIGYWKTALTQPADLFSSNTPGALAGEGAVFFVLGAAPAAVSLEGIKMMYKPSQESLGQALETFLSQHQLTPADIDLLITGQSGDSNHDHWYQFVQQKYFPDTIATPFKHLCGEYDTAGAFALWMAVQRMQEEERLKHVLIYNQFYGEQHTLMLLGR